MTDSLTFDDYNDICSDCTDHDNCHKNREINWEKLAECKKELQQIVQRG